MYTSDKYVSTPDNGEVDPYILSLAFGFDQDKGQDEQNDNDEACSEQNIKFNNQDQFDEEEINFSTGIENDVVITELDSVSNICSPVSARPARHDQHKLLHRVDSPVVDESDSPRSVEPAMHTQNITKLDPTVFEETPRVKGTDPSENKLSDKVTRSIEKKVIDTLKEIEDEIKERNVGITEEKYLGNSKPMDEKAENQTKSPEETVTFPYRSENKTVLEEPKEEKVVCKQFDIDRYSEIMSSNLDNEVDKEIESQPHTRDDINITAVDKTKVCEPVERKAVNGNSEFEDKIKEAIVSIELEENAEEGTLTDEELTQLKNKCMARLKNAAQES